MALTGILLTTVALPVLLISRYRERLVLAGTAKLVASSGFLVLAFSIESGVSEAYRTWILAGLVLGWIGDACLIPKDARLPFLAGLVSFLLGHVAYIVAAVINGFSLPIAGAAAVLCLIPGVVFWHWLAIAPDSSMRGPVVAYIAVITAMLAVGFATWGLGAYAWIIPGALLFYASDMGVAIDRFRRTGPPAYLWSLPLYYAGQVCFALSIGVAVPAP